MLRSWLPHQLPLEKGLRGIKLATKYDEDDCVVMKADGVNY